MPDLVPVVLQPEQVSVDHLPLAQPAVVQHYSLEPVAAVARNYLQAAVVQIPVVVPGLLADQMPGPVVQMAEQAFPA